MSENKLNNDVSCETFQKKLNGLLLPHGISVDRFQGKTLFDFWNTLIHWNKSHNLTSVTDIDTACSVHFADSLFPASFNEPFFDGAKILDVGTGGGFPGVPLSVYFKNCSFYLLDKSRKKISFINYAAASLDLKNVSGINDSLEALSCSKYDVILSRAVRVDGEFFKICKKLLNPAGYLIFFYSSKQMPFDDPSLKLVKNFNPGETIRYIAYYQF